MGDSLCRGTWDVGWIGNDLGDLGGHVLPNGGGGLRFELQERRNLLLDAGWGRGDRGFYFGIHEAF